MSCVCAKVAMGRCQFHSVIALSCYNSYVIHLFSMKWVHDLSYLPGYLLPSQQTQILIRLPAQATVVWQRFDKGTTIRLHNF